MHVGASKYMCVCVCACIFFVCIPFLRRTNVFRVARIAVRDTIPRRKEGRKESRVLVGGRGEQCCWEKEEEKGGRKKIRMILVWIFLSDGSFPSIHFVWHVCICTYIYGYELFYLYRVFHLNFRRSKSELTYIQRILNAH